MITSAYKENCYEFRGLSSDKKPVNELNNNLLTISNGSVFIEMDTGAVFMFNQQTNS